MSRKDERFYNGAPIPKETWDSIRLPARIERAIRLKHDHETEGSPPLWLIWMDRRDGDGIRLHAVADSVWAARYGAFIVLAQGEIYVERVPANHGFASSIQRKLDDAIATGVRAFVRIHGYRKDRPGD